MPRPRGYIVSLEEKERVIAGQRRAWAETRRPWVDMTRNIRAATDGLSDAEVERIRVMLLREVRALVAQTKVRRKNGTKARKAKAVNNSGIPRMTQRAAAQRRARNKLQGEPMGDDGAAYVPHRRNGPARPAYRGATSEDQHGPRTGRHSHPHAAFGNPVEHDGFHIHEHEHFGDADHNHHDEE
jgi:hypothetical protein